MTTEQTKRAKALFTTAQNLMWDIKTLLEEITDPAENEAVDALQSAKREASECRLHLQASYLKQ